ncbi:MAG: HEAT repeat domain-containing protein [Candidatus Latescibacterota bacterium]|nr:HEAT repeat domain-containing protein [Candidatus Latescibacterota bacterium]
MNKHQRAAFRPGEERVGREEIRELLRLSESNDSEDRLQAASFLCPCHVRKHIDEVWEALYRMLEDEDTKVRRAAWHTLDDGGKPDDPALDEIIERTLERDTDKQVLNFARQFAKGHEKRKEIEFEVAAISDYAERGKCDFAARRACRSSRTSKPNSTAAVGGASRWSARPATRPHKTNS